MRTPAGLPTVLGAASCAVSADTLPPPKAWPSHPPAGAADAGAPGAEAMPAPMPAAAAFAAPKPTEVGAVTAA